MIEPIKDIMHYILYCYIIYMRNISNLEPKSQQIGAGQLASDLDEPENVIGLAGSWLEFGPGRRLSICQ